MVNEKQKLTKSDYEENALYREIWGDVHTQKAYDFVKKNSKLLIIIAIFIFLLAVGNQVYREISKSNQRKSSRALESAMSMIADKQYDSAHSVLNKVADKYSTAMSDIARYQDAMLYAEEKNPEMYIKTMEKLSQSGNIRDYRDLATVRLSLIKGDNITAKEFEKSLSPVLSKRSPYYFTALWLVAKKYESENNEKLAIKYYKKIVENKKATPIIVANAEQALAALGGLEKK